ncbi:MAG: iron-sulfur cluster assembly accessory protein [Acidimicrobiia bacterium]|nr:MAG: iron-sulfur cluster assembly accessory protein [Acidimicrobiia bacterium]
MTLDERTETPVMLTADAAAKVSELIAQEEDHDLFLRLVATPGGCSGFRYDLHFDTGIDSNDTVAETGGVRLVIDAESVPRLIGATIDFKDEGIKGAGFAIENPNETGHQCTCGKR